MRDDSSDVVEQPRVTPRRRWLRFSLWSLLAFITVFAVGFGWVAREVSRARSEERALAKLKEVVDGGSVNVYLGDRFGDDDERYSREFLPKNKGWRAWIESAFGIDPFNTVKSLTVYGVGNGFEYGVDENRKMTINATYVSGLKDEDSDILLAFPYLEFLMLEANPIGDVGAARIATLKNISSIHLGNTTVTNVGVSELASLPRLDNLTLNRTLISDDVLKSFASGQLSSLDISATNLSDEAVNAFKKCNPNCQVKK